MLNNTTIRNFTFFVCQQLKYIILFFVTGLATLVSGKQTNDIYLLPDKAEIICKLSEKKIRQFLQHDHSDTTLINLLNTFAVCKKDSRPELAFEFANLSISLAQKVAFEKGIANGYHTLGMLYWDQSSYQLASKYFYDALKIREKIKDLKGLARTYHHIGNIYSFQKNYKDAIYYFKESMKIKNAIKDSIGLIDANNSIANVYLQQNKPELAKSYYLIALLMAKSLNTPEGEAAVETNIGQVHLKLLEFDLAYFNFEKALKGYRTTNHMHGIAHNLNQMALTKIKQKKDLSQALQFSKEALRIATLNKAMQIMSNAFANLSTIHAMMENYKMALHYEQQYRITEAKIHQEERARAIIDTQARYGYAKRKAELLKTERELAGKNIFIILLVLIAAIIIGFITYSRLRLQERTNSLLEEKNNELLISNQALEKFAYVSAHDLKEPLRTIGAFSTLLKRRYENQLDKDGKDYIKFIVKGVDQMYQLLDDLLVYSRLIHNKDAYLKEVNLEEVVNSVTFSLNKSLEEKKVHIKIGNLPVVQTNHSQMHQLFQNLVNNAIKFNDKDRPEIDIQVQKLEKEYLFSVKDNGIGISKQFHNKIFGVFQRLFKEEYPGTGVGLAICQKIVEQHNGKIWVESEEGKGSTFYFTLPEYEQNKQEAHVSKNNKHTKIKN